MNENRRRRARRTRHLDQAAKWAMGEKVIAFRREKADVQERKIRSRTTRWGDPSTEEEQGARSSRYASRSR